jgi:hypothetical protein
MTVISIKVMNRLEDLKGIMKLYHKKNGEHGLNCKVEIGDKGVSNLFLLV